MEYDNINNEKMCRKKAVNQQIYINNMKTCFSSVNVIFAKHISNDVLNS